MNSASQTSMCLSITGILKAVSDSTGLGRGLSKCISNKHPESAEPPGR